jgi:hypothetical protein
MRRTIFIIAICLLGSVHQARSEVTDQRLKDVKQITLLVEELHKDSTYCGVTKDFIREAFMYPASSARFKVVGSSPAVFYINVNTGRAGDDCFSAIDIQLYMYQRVKLQLSNRIVYDDVVLWSTGGILGSDRSTHGQKIREAVEEYTKRFIPQWNLDNKDTNEWLNNYPVSKGNTADPYSGSTLIGRAAGQTDEPSRTGALGAPMDDDSGTLAPLPKRAANETPPPEAASAAVNEQVFVKYRGPVNLAAFACEPVTKSSFIRRVCYDAKNAYMLIDLNGTYYHYCEIDEATVTGLLTAPSMGRFFNASIKRSFDCRTHRVPAY